MDTKPPFDEEQLVARAKQGDRQALSQLVIEYRSRIYHLGLRLTGSEQDAEDILQEAFLIMVKKIHQFKGNSSFYTWLYRIAVNIGLRKLKSKPRKYQHISLDDPDIEHIGTAETAEWPDFDYSQISHKPFRKKLDKLIEKLPDIYRTVFILRDLHELSTEDTSKILQITPSNTKIRLMRARNFLKEELEKVITKEGLI
ncbi:MAG: RNA polymerase sigma factor [Fidelibacterota bacterium]